MSMGYGSSFENKILDTQGKEVKTKTNYLPNIRLTKSFVIFKFIIFDV
jgi:hypothetical protein